MSYIDIILLAIALSIDACVVSFSYGLCIEKSKRLSAFFLALTTGIFQAVMPVIGYLFTDMVRIYIEPYSKWIVFVIFIYLGVNFILESFKTKKTPKLCLELGALLLIGIATSIDAFSAGIPLSLTSSPMLFSILTIGFVTFVDSIAGYCFGYFSKCLNAKWLEIAGGLILIGLAVKSVV